jgi:Lrp/AsnC family transcriptional regulator for asnA, asnC and gidA
MNNEIDEIDIAILKALREDARASYREIAAKVGVAVGTVQNRMNKLVDRGVLQGFSPLIDFKKLGYSTDAIIALSVKRGMFASLKEKLNKHPNVISIYEVAGNMDVLLRVMFHDTEELYNFLTKELPDDAINASITYSVLNKIRNRADMKLL